MQGSTGVLVSCVSCSPPFPLAAFRRWSYVWAPFREPADVADVRDQLQSALGTAYAIERELGGGGMSRVFVATEAALGRRVVVKVLPPEMSGAVSAERFRREVTVAARLQHPCIVPLLSAGEADGLLYYTMPFVRGDSLRAQIARGGAMPIAEVMRVLRDVASALSHAHAAGVVHRDLKPDNVLLSGGYAVVTDFGIAKALSAAATPAASVTATNVVVGTPLYMAPEQAVGDPAVDHRADLYALGVVAYELLVGAPPFSRRTPQQLVVAHITELPVPLTSYRPDAPPALASLVMWCLEKDPDRRPQSVAELLERLVEPAGPATGAAATTTTGRDGALPSRASAPRASLPAGVRSGAPPGPVSIAVLPFVNRSGDADSDYFSDGMTEELINALAKVRDLRVAARTSSFRFRDATDDVRAIGSRLNVGTILEGSVRRMGARLRVTAQLIDAGDGFQLWSGSYARDVEDVFAIQEEIAHAIVSALVPRLTSASISGPAVRRVQNLEAYELYLKGRYNWNKRTAEALDRALRFFEQAAALEPSFAEAHAGIADTYDMLGQYECLKSTEAFPKAKAAAARALAIDEGIAEARCSLAFALFSHDWDYGAAEREFTRALELNPSYALAHQWFGQMLGVLGRGDEAVAECRAAIALDPLSPVALTNLANALYCSRRYEDAIAQCHATIELEPRFFLTYFFLSLSLAETGRAAESITAARRGVALAPDSPLALEALGYACARAGEREEAQRIAADFAALWRTGRPTALNVAYIAGALGDIDEGFTWLERAVAHDRADKVVYLNASVGDPFRADPRFASLLARVGLRP